MTKTQPKLNPNWCKMEPKLTLTKGLGKKWSPPDRSWAPPGNRIRKMKKTLVRGPTLEGPSWDPKLHKIVENREEFGRFENIRLAKSCSFAKSCSLAKS